MADLLFVGTTVVFFAAAVGLVRLCDKVIGPDSDTDAHGSGEAELTPELEPTGGAR